ncbi:MAG: DUF3971 domain-containing protein, partial [Alphaproteobacteria bacterium]|nr:DUF3971 domain-containing protein [Alphaproteobacteria bacterium]
MILRTSLILLELVGGLLAGLVILAAVAIWWLSSGPVSLSFLTPYIEEAVSVEERSIAVRIQDTVLVWAGWDRAVDIRANNVTILGSGGKILATLPEVSLGLSLNAMMFGTVAPTSLDILGFSATVERAEDGRIDMGFIAGEDSPADEAFVRELPAIFSDLMGPPDSGGAFSYLRRVSLLNVDLRFEDRLKDAMWHAPNADVVFVRGERGFEVDAVLDLDFEGRESRVSGHLVFARERPTMAATFHFVDLRPSDVASRLKAGEILSRFDLPLAGSIDAKIRKDGALESLAFEIEGAAGSVAGDVVIPSDQADITVSARLVDLKIVDFAHILPGLTALQMLDVAIAGGVVGKFSRAGEVRAFDFDLSGGKGWLDLKDKLPAPIEVAGLRLKGAVEDGLFHARIDEAFIDFGGPSILVDASAYRLGGNYRLRLDARLAELPMGDLESYWPIGLGVTARNWTTANIRKGVVREGHLNMVMQLPVERPSDMSVESISGTMKYDGLEVGYLADLPKVAEVAGTATFGRDRFDLDVTGGRLADVTIDHGLINMTKLDTDNERIVIDLVLRGPLRTALEVLDRDPLNFVSELGFDPKGVGGDLAMRLGFRFPLRADVKRNQINIAVSSKLRGVTLDPGPFDLKLHDGNLS